MAIGVPLPALPASSPFETAEYKQLLQRLHDNRAQPRPKEWKHLSRWEMSTIHSFYVDLLMRVYAYAEYAVEKDDLADYLGFADCAFAQLHEHHHFEEEYWFPFVEASIGDGDKRLTRNVEEHQLFDKELAAAWIYMRACRSNLTPAPRASPVCKPPADLEKIDTAQYGLDASKGFSAGALRKHMDSWMLPLIRHLNGEIETLDPDWLEKMGEKKYRQGEKEVLKHLQSYDPSWFLISVIGSLPNTINRQLLALPYPVRRLLVPLVWAGKCDGYWKYIAHPENLTFWGIAAA